MSDVAAEFQQDDDETQRAKDLSILKAHANQIAEHFDSVEIIATRFKSPKEGSQFACSGVGNWYARYGSVRTWLKNEDGQLLVPRSGE